METEKRRLITVKEARKLMGKASAGFSDERVDSIIEQLSSIAGVTAKEAYKRLTKELVPKSPVDACNTQSITEEYS
jgi:hypothetical protein